MKFTSAFPYLLFRIYLFYNNAENLLYYRIKDKIIESQDSIIIKQKINICDGIDTIVNIKYNHMIIANDITDIITDMNIEYEEEEDTTTDEN